MIKRFRNAAAALSLLAFLSPVVPWRAFTDHAGWDALAACAAEPNPFAERWCLANGLAGFDRRPVLHGV